MRRGLGLIVAIAIGISAFPAFACDDADHAWPAFLKIETERGWQHHELNTIQRLNFMHNFNMIPPQTNTKADHVYIGTHERDETHQITSAFAVVADDCVIMAMAISETSLDILLKSPSKESTP